MGRLWFGNRPVTLLVGDNRTVNIDTSLNIESDNPVTNKAITTEIDALNTELLAVKSDLFNANQEIETLTLALQSSDYEIEILKSDVQNLTDSLNTLRSEFDSHSNYVNNYQTQNSNNIVSIYSRLEELESYHASSNEGVQDSGNLDDMFG